MSKKKVYPPYNEVFRAFDECSYESLKVVIIGQDPYHGPNQANGLAFSVRHGVRIPPSLVNIIKELETDVGYNSAWSSGDLTKWAKQGVLLLNNVLTVEDSKAGSHRGKGWERFTDFIVEHINTNKAQIVFFLWGRDAQTKGKNIDEDRHLVLKSVHPSPLSAHRGFFGCKHFTKANDYLKSSGKEPIDWRI